MYTSIWCIRNSRFTYERTPDEYRLSKSKYKSKIGAVARVRIQQSRGSQLRPGKLIYKACRWRTSGLVNKQQEAVDGSRDFIAAIRFLF